MDLLRKVWHAWKKFGQAMGDLVARLVLTLFYFTVFLPFGIAVRLWGDPLEIKPGQRARWRERTTRDLQLEDARRLG